jgi:hypothetical protein
VTNLEIEYVLQPMIEYIGVLTEESEMKDRGKKGVKTEGRKIEERGEKEVRTEGKKRGRKGRRKEEQ